MLQPQAAGRRKKHLNWAHAHTFASLSLTRCWNTDKMLLKVLPRSACGKGRQRALTIRRWGMNRRWTLRT